MLAGESDGWLKTQSAFGIVATPTSRMKRKNPHAVALGRKGGQIGGAVRSAIKALAARENGKKGGRPRNAVSSRGKSSE